MMKRGEIRTRHINVGRTHSVYYDFVPTRSRFQESIIHPRVEIELATKQYKKKTKQQQTKAGTNKPASTSSARTLGGVRTVN
jgi:hypothetical protein